MQAGEVLFKYEASFTYLSSDDNAPIESDLFLVFPCPLINNEPALTKENLRWQLWGLVSNEYGSWLELEVDNGRVIQLVGERTSFSPLFWYSTFIHDTSHGSKIWLQFGPGPDNSLYQGEKALVRAEFAVPREDVDRITLVDNHGGIYGGADGYSYGRHKPIRYSMGVSLSKKVDNIFESIGTFSYVAEDLVPELAWVELKAV